MYILSVPAFEWFKANYTSISPRAGHTCHPAGNNQMILIGGSSPIQFKDNTMEAWNGTADPWAQGIGVFDMTNLVWRDSYNANAQPYTVPKIIKQYYDKKYVIPSTVVDTIASAPAPIFEPYSNMALADHFPWHGRLPMCKHFSNPQITPSPQETYLRDTTLVEAS